MLYPDGTGTLTTLGSDLAAGERPHFLASEKSARG
jgi:hypothetical protein